MGKLCGHTGMRKRLQKETDCEKMVAYNFKNMSVCGYGKAPRPRIIITLVDTFLVVVLDKNTCLKSPPLPHRALLCTPPP